MLIEQGYAESFALENWEPAIFDRTLEDVEFAIRNRNDGIQYKGAQGYQAWNRLTNNIYYLAETLTSIGIPVTVNSRRYFDILSLPTYSEVLQIRKDIQTLLNAAAMEREIPELPFTHYEKINLIERFTEELRQFYSDRTLSKFPLNTFYLGMEGILI